MTSSLSRQRRRAASDWQPFVLSGCKHSAIDPRVETPEEARDRVLEAARYIPVEQLGTTDDCGFAPFCDDVSTTRATAFAKIRARVEGTTLAEQVLGVR